MPSDFDSSRLHLGAPGNHLPLHLSPEAIESDSSARFPASEPQSGRLWEVVS